MDNNSRSPYVSRPDGNGQRSEAYRRYNNEANSMAVAASTLGLIAILSVLTLKIYPGIVLGALTLILAILSRDGAGKMHDKAKSGIVMGIGAIGVNLVILGLSFGLVFSTGPFKDEVNDMCREIYGQTFDDMWEDMKDGSMDLEYRNLPIGVTAPVTEGIGSSDT